MKTVMTPAARKAMIHRVVSASSRLEGLSFERAKNNKTAINKLKKYGRGFAIESDVEELHFQDEDLNKQAVKLAKLLK